LPAITLKTLLNKVYFKELALAMATTTTDTGVAVERPHKLICTAQER
jgi:hypothetical protein